MRKQRELLFWALWRFSHLIVKIISNKSSCCCSSGGFHSPKKICYHKIHLLFGIMLQKTVGIVSFLQAERHWWWCCSGESCTLGFDWHLIDIWLTCHHGNRGLTANNMLATRRRWMHVTHQQLHSVSSRSAPAEWTFLKKLHLHLCDESPPAAFWKKVERSDKRRWEKHFSLVGLMQPHTLVLYLKENVGAHNKKNKIYVDTDAQGSVAESTVASIGTDWLVCLGFIRDADNDTHTHGTSHNTVSH